MKVRVSDDEFIVVTSSKDTPRDLVETLGALAVWLGMHLDVRIEHRMIVIKHPNRLTRPIPEPWDGADRRAAERRQNGRDRRHHMDRRHGYP